MGEYLETPAPNSFEMKLMGFMFVGLVVYSVAFFIVFNSTYPPDLVISNTYLCLEVDGTCNVVGEGVIRGENFEKIHVCTDYSSSKKTSIEINLIGPGEFQWFGMMGDDGLEAGEHQVCYSLKDAVDSMQNSNMGNKPPNPVHEGVIEPGNYRVAFDHGRIDLGEIWFEVVP